MSTERRQSVAEISPEVLALLPAKAADVARALGRAPSDGTVRKALQGLAASGAAEQVDGLWRPCEQLATFPPPEDFDDESRELFESTLLALQEQGTWRDHDVELLERYVRRKQDVREFRAAVADAGAFQTSANGGRVYAHPGIDKERDALRDVQGLADALVLTPDGRKRHGRDGNGNDPDPFDF